MKISWILVVSAALAVDLCLANPAYKDLSKTKKGGSRGGFYSSRFGSVYDAKDFAEEPTTAAPAPLREVQVPTGVAGPHQQNIDEEIKSEVPNIDEATTTSVPLISEDLRLGVKGGIKGARRTPPIRLSTEPPPIRVTVLPNGAPTMRSDVGVTNAPLINENLKRKTKGVKGGRKGYQYDPKSIRELFTDVTEQPVEVTTVERFTDAPIRVTELVPTIQPVDVTVPPLVSDNLTKKKTKGIKGGRKGYQYDVKNIRELFSDDKVTERPVEATTVESYNPQILNLPTERRAEIITTENYRQETVAPVQQTEEPIQQTEEPIQQTEEPIQQTEEPIQQTEIPVQQTEEPIREVEPTTRRPLPTTVQQTLPPVTTEPYEPVQDTQSPLEPQVTQRPELPSPTTFAPTTTEYYNDQQTELPQITQLPEEPYQVTQVPTTQLPVKADEFSKYPLGLEGSLPIRGGGAGKGKGGKGWKGSKKSFQTAAAPTVAVLNRGATGFSSRREMSPATPLLPSLRGYQG